MIISALAYPVFQSSTTPSCHMRSAGGSGRSCRALTTCGAAAPATLAAHRPLIFRTRVRVFVSCSVLSQRDRRAGVRREPHAAQGAHRVRRHQRSNAAARVAAAQPVTGLMLPPPSLTPPSHLAHVRATGSTMSARFSYFTLRPVAAGAELLVDYRHEERGHWPFVCRCGSENCKNPPQQK